MKPLRVAATLAVLAWPLSFAFWPVAAHAQMPNINLLADGPSKSPEQIEKEQAQEKAYKESLKKIPDAKTSSDPWGSVRSDAPKSAPAKSAGAAKKTKTGSNAPN